MRNRSSAAQTRKPAADPIFGDIDQGAETPPPPAQRSPVPPETYAAADEEGYPTMEHRRLVDRVYKFDFQETADRLERDLKLSMRASRADYSTVIDALDQATENASHAMALFAHARVSHEAFEIDATSIIGAMRKEAKEALEAAKMDGEGKPIKGTKQITEADVEAYCASQYADQWRRIQMDRIQSRKAVDYYERFAEIWKDRCRYLGIMAQGLARQ